jgi:hypothetical protein
MEYLSDDLAMILTVLPLWIIAIVLINKFGLFNRHQIANWRSSEHLKDFLLHGPLELGTEKYCAVNKFYTVFKNYTNAWGKDYAILNKHVIAAMRKKGVKREYCEKNGQEMDYFIGIGSKAMYKSM